MQEEDVGRAALLAKVGTESIWTVDLLFLLQVRPCVFFFFFFKQKTAYEM